jgi:integrase
MGKSTVERTSDKPNKPYPDFPLFAHATRRWAKKILGKTHYFGPWEDPNEALQTYAKQKDDLYAGRDPNAGSEVLTVADLANQFLIAKRQLMDAGELTARTWRDYYVTCERLVDQFGKNRRVTDLKPVQFDRFKANFAKTLSPVTLGNEVNRVRVILNWAFEQGLLQTPIRFGPGFKRPSKKVMRLEKAKRGSKMIEAADLRKLLDKATVQMKAMIMLGVNAGLGNTDVAELQSRHLDLDGGWIDYPRPKTGVGRRCKLWPETITAIREAIAIRPLAKSPADADCVFLTDRGLRLVLIHPRENKPGVKVDAVTRDFGQLLTQLELKRPGLGFYALRHCFETIGGESRDQVAVDVCMGHADPSMGAHYRERISDDRLAAVADVVRAWLWAKDESPATIPISSAVSG